MILGWVPPRSAPLHECSGWCTDCTKQSSQRRRSARVSAESGHMQLARGVRELVSRTEFPRERFGMSLQLVQRATEREALATAVTPTASMVKSDDVIVDVAATLAEVHSTSSMRLALEIGEIVVRRIFDGDLQRVRAHGPKDVSFRKLAACPRLTMSAMRIWRAVGVFELVSRMPGLKDAKNLSVSHLYAVLGLPNETQEWLLRAAADGRWRVEELEAQATKHRPSESRRRPRMAQPELIVSLRRIERITCRFEFGAKRGLAEAGFDEEQVRHVRECVEKIRAWCDSVGEMLAE